MNRQVGKALGAGILLAILSLRVLHSFSIPISYQLFTLFLAYTACVYFGAALSDGRVKWLTIETLISAVFYVCAILGLLYSSKWVALGYILHGIWDMLHHAKIVKTKIEKWFPPFCAMYDFIVAVFILTFY